MDIKIEGNPGTGNTFQKISQEIHIGTVGTYSNASVINNYYGTVGELSGKKKKQEGAEDDTHDDPKQPIPGNRQREQLKESEEEIDYSPIRTEILNYVSRVRPLVHPDKRDRYMKMWEGILELDESIFPVFTALIAASTFSLSHLNHSLFLSSSSRIAFIPQYSRMR